MSIDSCKKCGTIVDTDFNPEAYDLGKCLCSNCQDNHREYELLIMEIDAFSNRIFDHVAGLNRVDMLELLREFKQDVQEELNG